MKKIIIEKRYKNNNLTLTNLLNKNIKEKLQ